MDAGRALLSAQSDCFKSAPPRITFFTGYAAGEGQALYTNIPVMQAEIPATPAEMKTRPRNIAFNYIVRAA